MSKSLTKRPKSKRVLLKGISARAYEHPADRAALAALRKVPGFDLLLRKIIGFVGERSIRYLYLGSAVRVSGTQLPRIHTIYRECLNVLDIDEEFELYVAQTPLVNAGAVGVEQPFIVLNSGTIDLFDDDELRFVIGHELGHILSGHVLYKTMLKLLVNLSVSRLGIPLAPLVFLGIVAALKEWDRKSELSCDRAGLLCVQDPKVGYNVQMKMAGGKHVDQMNLDEFMQQASDYDAAGDALDGVVKLLNLLGQTHPFSVIRLAELRKWVDSGKYQAIVDGEYELRADDAQSSMYEDMANGAKSYRDNYAQSQDPLFRFVQDLGDAGLSVLDKARSKIKSKTQTKTDDSDPK